MITGQKLGPYRILGRLGEGAMGQVYRAQDIRLDRTVAIKVLPEALANDLQHRERFEREARIISRLNHPHICTIHDVGRHGEVSFIVMELVEGETLRDWIGRQRRVDARAVMTIATQIAQALAAAHAAGIVHRDIKPANVMVRADGSIKVLDFGVAHVETPLDGGEDVTRPPATVAGTVIGTVEYMSPEQVRGLPVDARADVFSFGILLYEMLTGERPFCGATTMDIAASILQHDPPAVSRLRPESGPALSGVVATCLLKDPARRYASGRELAEALAELEKSPVSASAPPSIAVLPFVNMSAETDDYFCDGLAEDLINALTKLENLHVAARTSAFAVKQRQIDLREAGRVLNVRTVLEGSVRKSGRRLRVTAQLVNVEDGYQLWSERYDRLLEDVFAIQDEISIAIVAALKVKLLGDEKAALTRRQTENVEAYDLYLQGRHHWQSWTPDGLARARACFEQAIAQDPSYALAFTGLADTILAYCSAGLAPHREKLPEVMPILRRAIAIDPELPEGWNQLGVAHFLNWEFGAAHEAISRALQLNPRNAQAHSARASAFMLEGRYAEALEPALRSIELDPLAPLWAFSVMVIEIGLGRFGVAEEHARRVLAFDARNWTAHYVCGLVATARGDFDCAVKSFEDATQYSARNARSVAALAYALARNGKMAEAENILADLERLAAQEFVPQIAFATAYLAVRDLERTFEALDRSFEDRDNWLRLAWWNPLFCEARRDPRMLDLMRRMNLADAAIADATPNL